MATEIKVPAVGESVTEGTVARWLKREGESVQAGEPVVELETEKATTEVPAPAAGMLHIEAAEGQTVSVGGLLGAIDESAVEKRPPEQAEPNKARTAKETDKRERAEPKPLPERRSHEGPSPEPLPKEAAGEAEEPFLTPAARELALGAGLDPRELTGTGRGGRVLKEDVERVLEERKKRRAESAGPAAAKHPPPKAEPTAPTRPPPEAGDGRAIEQARAGSAPPLAPEKRETRQRMSVVRQRIAQRLVAAQRSAAILSTFNEADLSSLLALRAQHQEEFEKQHGVKLGLMSFFIKAAIEALKAFPVANAAIDGEDIAYHHYYDIGVAVSTDKGLMVPVIRDADRLGFADIERKLAELAEKARQGKIAVTDLEGGTFTITNGGVFGSLLSTPLLNPPQSAILGMHVIQRRPIAVGDQVVIRPMMYLALSYDHRLMDGREAVGCLRRIKECIEDPVRMLLQA